jgi:acetolactate synthase small subunit
LYETLEKINKIIPQIKKIVPIIEVKNITDRNVAKELVLVSYTKESKKMRQIILNYSAKKICVEDGINVIELVAISEIIDNFVKDLNSAGYYNIVRSGILAIEIK